MRVIQPPTGGIQDPCSAPPSCSKELRGQDDMLFGSPSPPQYTCLSHYLSSRVVALLIPTLSILRDSGEYAGLLIT